MDGSSSTVSSVSVSTLQPVDLVPVQAPLLGVQYGIVVLDFLLAAVLGCLLAKAANWFKW